MCTTEFSKSAGIVFTGGGGLCRESVSYTHLDVYKRQDMLIIGEIWHYAGDFLEGDEWDTVMNYPFYLNLIDLLAEDVYKRQVLVSSGR